MKKGKPGPKPKQAARFDYPPIEERPNLLGGENILDNSLDEKESAADFDAAEEEQRAKEKEKKEVSPRILKSEKPLLEKGQRYFETIDGRFLVGPIDAGSIKDPLNPNHEVNPWRPASSQLHRR